MGPKLPTLQNGFTHSFGHFGTLMYNLQRKLRHFNDQAWYCKEILLHTFSSSVRRQDLCDHAGCRVVVLRQRAPGGGDISSFCKT